MRYEQCIVARMIFSHFYNAQSQSRSNNGHSTLLPGGLRIYLLIASSGDPRGLLGSTLLLLPLENLPKDCLLLGGLGSRDCPFLANCWGTFSVEALRTRDMRALRTVSMKREPLDPEADTSLEVGLTGQATVGALATPKNSLVFCCSSSVRDSSSAERVLSWSEREK